MPQTRGAVAAEYRAPPRFKAGVAKVLSPVSHDAYRAMDAAPLTEADMEAIDWSKCEGVERIPGKVSGSWLVKDTRLPVWAILANADDHTPEEIANEIFEGVTA